MRHLNTAATACLLATVLTGAAQADNFLKYGAVEGWTVYVDRDKKSCLIEIVDGSENVIQMGLTQDRGVGYLGVFTKRETNIKQGETGTVAILIGENIYLGEATGIRGTVTKGYTGGYVLSDDPQFAKDIAPQYTMTVFPEKEFSFVVDLTGTKKALEMARECNQKQISG